MCNGHYCTLIIIIIKDIYVVQVCMGHKCAMSAMQAVLYNCHEMVVLVVVILHQSFSSQNFIYVGSDWH